MGNAAKVVLVVMLIGVMLTYILVEAAIQEEYAGKIAALRRDIDQYDTRGEQLYREAVRLEYASSLLEAQLASEQQAAQLRAQEEQHNSQLRLALGGISSAGLRYNDTALAPLNLTINAPVFNQTLNLAAIRRTTSSGSSTSSSAGRTTRAS
jgi:hypothetical protein